MIFNRRGSHNITNPRHVCHTESAREEGIHPDTYHSFNQYQHHQQHLNRQDMSANDHHHHHHIPSYTDNLQNSFVTSLRHDKMSNGITNIALDMSSEDESNSGLDNNNNNNNNENSMRDNNNMSNTHSSRRMSSTLTQSQDMKETLNHNLMAMTPSSLNHHHPLYPEDTRCSVYRSKPCIQLTWKDVSFTVNSQSWSWPEGDVFPCRRRKVKQIIETQSGQVSSGQLIGIIGPSGAGKSTLLNCLTGRYREQHGMRGSVYVQTITPAAKDTLNASLEPLSVVPHKKIKNKMINVAFIPQKDNLFANFTVKETLVFASKMKNSRESIAASGGSDDSVNDFDHEKEAVKVMKYLNLESCAKTYIKKCSGGQVKRVCIGVELISRPDILVLDEPTTGLDSSTAYQCVSILRNLVDAKAKSGSSPPPAIIATIHQPSCKILMKFNLIYLLSKNGKCLYFGPPDKIKGHFMSAGLEFPSEYNPADFAIETAYGDYGEEIFDKLNAITRKSTATMLSSSSLSLSLSSNLMVKDNNNTTELNGHNDFHHDLHHQFEQPKIKISTIVKSMESRPYSVFDHIFLLLIRNWKKIYRDGGQLYLRVFQNIAIGLMVSFLWNPDIGSEDGCWSDFLEAGAKAGNATDAKMQYLQKITRINSNAALLFAFLIYVIMVSVMSTVLSFPSETLVILKEMKNNWYSCSSYYWSKMIAEIPILCLMIFILAIIIYPLTGQIPILWRFLLVYIVTCMMGEVCQSIGMLFGTIFSDDLISACFSSVASGFPPILFGGFVVQFQYIRWYLKPFAYLSYLKYAFESLVIAIYGFNRCTKPVAGNAVDNIAKAKNPVELIGTLVSTFNLTSKDAQTFSVLLNVDQSCIEGVINGTIDYFGINKGSNNDAGGDDDYDYGDETTTTVKPLYSLPSQAKNDQKEEASYVLSYFGLKDDLIYTNIAALIVFMLVLKIATYSVLKYKSRK